MFRLFLKHVRVFPVFCFLDFSTFTIRIFHPLPFTDFLTVSLLSPQKRKICSLLDFPTTNKVQVYLSQETSNVI